MIKKFTIQKIGIVAISTLILLLTLLPLTHGELRNRGESFQAIQVPILLYHRFGPMASDSMTVTTDNFKSDLKYLSDNGYRVIPLGDLVDYYLGRKKSPLPHSVVITVDDGHKSVYTDVLPLVKKYQIPVTLFIYPSAISNANYAMAWSQLRELKETGLFDFQSHTYWHPNFKKDKARLKPAEYESSVVMQLRKSKDRLEKEFSARVNMLAWPFGIYDDDLIRKAKGAGYVATFTMERHPASNDDNVMVLPRFLMTNGERAKTFARSFLKGEKSS
ncbi:MAG: polysaccharide deacetylase family protein [Thermodesulfobacteriota bacterium]